MPYLAVLLVALQIGFAVHAVRNGKGTSWVWLIITMPGLGCAIYFFTQVLTGLAGSRSTNAARSTLVKALDPQRELRRRRDLLEVSDTISNRLLLSDECFEAGMFDVSIELLTEARAGMHQGDHAILERLAQAQFHNGEPGLAVTTLNELISLNPGYESHDGHLLYARALEATGLTEEAKREYEVLRESYPGEEARVRYAQLLVRSGETSKAMGLFEESLTRARRAPEYYRKKEREWLKIAEQGAR